MMMYNDVFPYPLILAHILDESLEIGKKFIPLIYSHNYVTDILCLRYEVIDSHEKHWFRRHESFSLQANIFLFFKKHF